MKSKIEFSIEPGIGKAVGFIIYTSKLDIAYRQSDFLHKTHHCGISHYMLSLSDYIKFEKWARRNNFIKGSDWES